MTQWKESLTHTEHEAVKYWSNGGYGEIRKQVDKGSMSSQAKEFMAAISKAPKFEGVVYRGLSVSQHGENYGYKQLQNILKQGVGGTWWDTAPMSTSIIPSTATGFAGHNGLVLRVASKTARPIMNAVLSDMHHEKEVIGMPGVKYRIRAIHKDVEVKTEKGYSWGKKLAALVELEEI
jgi:hypothetical protein